MPYYHYDVHTEIALRDNNAAIAEIEKAEEIRFNELLSWPENKLIDLLDLFFPPRFRKKAWNISFYPTLPSKYRKRALELIHRAILDKKFPVKFERNDLKLETEILLSKETIDVSTNVGYIRLWSQAVISYDSLDYVLHKASNLLLSLVDTRYFVEFLIEHDLLPFELLNFKVILDIFIQWNNSRLKSLPDKLKKEEGWPLIDVVSMLSNFYVQKERASSNGIITEFQTRLSVGNHPLRFGQEESDNMTENAGFRRQLGNIDSGKLPDLIVEMGKRWNENLKKIQTAMLLDRIKHTGINGVNRVDIRLDEITLNVWAKKNGHIIFHMGELPVEPPVRNNALHLLINDHRDALIKANGEIPNNQSIWKSIFDAWAAKKIGFIDEMSRWGDSTVQIEWTCEYGDSSKPQIMTKKSFQTHMSQHYPKFKK